MKMSFSGILSGSFQCAHDILETIYHRPSQSKKNIAVTLQGADLISAYKGLCVVLGCVCVGDDLT